MPFLYPLCVNYGCPKGDTCLRLCAARQLPESMEHCMMLNPRRVASVKESCPYYRSIVKVRYAKGFIGMLDELTCRQARSVLPALMNCFSRRTYFRIRKGERSLSPSEQKQVLRIFKECGYTGPTEFDEYFEEFEW